MMNAGSRGYPRIAALAVRGPNFRRSVILLLDDRSDLNQRASKPLAITC
jgi:hypothetical protein